MTELFISCTFYTSFKGWSVEVCEKQSLIFYKIDFYWRSLFLVTLTGNGFIKTTLEANFHDQTQSESRCMIMIMISVKADFFF